MAEFAAERDVVAFAADLIYINKAFNFRSIVFFRYTV
jgi:hypothetical protein